MIALSFVACMAMATTVNDLPAEILPAMRIVEGGRDGLTRHNRNGSRDLGVMQINTVWLQPLSQATGLPHTEVRSRLLDDGCFNVAAAGAILRMYREQAGDNLWSAVGNYHSHSTFRNVFYQARVRHTVHAMAKAERLEARRVAFENRLIAEAARDIRLQDNGAAVVSSLRSRTASEYAAQAFADRHDDRDELSIKDRYDLDRHLARYAGGELWSGDDDDTCCPDTRPRTNAAMSPQKPGSARLVRLARYDRSVAAVHRAARRHLHRISVHPHPSYRISSHDRADHRRRV